MAAATDAARPQNPPDPPSPPRAPKSPRWARTRRALLPYALLLPAVCFELLVHIIPMLVGIWVSFKMLTIFFIRTWTSAPSAGLQNYRFALNFNNAVGQTLLHSFWVTLGFSVLVVALSWLIGAGAAVLMQNPFAAAACCAPTSWCRTRCPRTLR